MLLIFHRDYGVPTRCGALPLPLAGCRIHTCRGIGGATPLPKGEVAPKARVRGFALSRDLNPSPDRTGRCFASPGGDRPLPMGEVYEARGKTGSSRKHQCAHHQRTIATRCVNPAALAGPRRAKLALERGWGGGVSAIHTARVERVPPPGARRCFASLGTRRPLSASSARRGSQAGEVTGGPVSFRATRTSLPEQLPIGSG